MKSPPRRTGLRDFLGAIIPGRRIWMAVVLHPAGIDYGKARFTYARAYLDTVDWQNKIAAGHFGFPLNRCHVTVGRKGETLRYRRDG